jgi:PmbA protein
MDRLTEATGAGVERLIDGLHSSQSGDLAVQAWSVYASESRRLSLGIKDQEAGNAHAPLTLSESCGARYLIVWSDGSLSRGFLQRRQLDDAPEQTLQAARTVAYQDPDAAHVLGPAEMPSVKTCHPAASDIADGDTALVADRLSEVRRCIADAGARTWSGSFSASHRTARLVTSRGLDATAEGTGFGWFVTVDGEIGSGKSGRGPEDGAAFTGRLDRLVDVARRLRNPGKTISGGTSSVLLHPRVVEGYVLGTLLHHLDGSTVSHSEGLFSRDQFGTNQPVLREDLSLRLDPLEPLRSGSYRFTSEGVPARACSFIERGCLVQPVLDVKYSRRLGLPTTALPQSMDTLHLEGPTRLDLAQALERAGSGALVLSVLGIHTQDSASGDFSLSAPQVLRIDEGALGGRTRATISGNLFEALRSPSLQLVQFDGEHTPGMLFPCRIDGAD